MRDDITNAPHSPNQRLAKFFAQMVDIDLYGITLHPFIPSVQNLFQPFPGQYPSGLAIGFPRIQGIDVCGNIVAVGSKVDKDRIGERILIEPCLREVGGRKLEQPWFLG